MPEAGSVQGVTLSRDQISWSLEGATALPVTKVARRAVPLLGMSRFRVDDVKGKGEKEANNKSYDS
jgi:hypothetical protein